MRKKKVQIISPQGYPWLFNGPRRSRNEIRRERFIPFNKLIDGMDGVTVFNPISIATADLIHAFNRIPINNKRFVIGFESHIPRTFGFNRPYYESYLWNKLLSDQCAQIFPISKFALNTFKDQIKRRKLSAEDSASLLSKTTVRYPNIPIPEFFQASNHNDLVITFVGGHFARKGGCVLARAAEECHKENLPVKFNVISKLEVGGGIWTDPSREQYFEKYLKLLSLPNINLVGKSPNDIVQKMLKNSDLGFLTTFADTFGFSAVEAMTHGTPMIATAQAAIPEFISHGETGFLVSPAVTPNATGWEPDYSKRGTPEFEELFTSFVERMVTEVMAIIRLVLEDRQRLRDMRHAAYDACKNIFSADDASNYWDDVYERVSS